MGSTGKTLDGNERTPKFPVVSEGIGGKNISSGGRSIHWKKGLYPEGEKSMGFSVGRVHKSKGEKEEYLSGGREGPEEKKGGSRKRRDGDRS